MAKFRKKPVIIDAYQWFVDDTNNDVELLEKPIRVGDLLFKGKIKTLEDTDESCHYVCESDWIITGVQGEKYACKHSIFIETYEKID